MKLFLDSKRALPILAGGTRSNQSRVRCTEADYRLTPELSTRFTRPRKCLDTWAVKVTANGEVVERT